MKITEPCIVKEAVYDRPDDANKGDCGSLLSVCGCFGMAGAAVMAGKAALRCGLGLLKTALPESIYPIAAQALPESVFFSLKQTDDGKISAGNIQNLLEQSEKCGAVLMGCGLSVCEDTVKSVREMITSCRKRLVLDADALNCIADDPDILMRAAYPPVITPHPGEMARLCGLSVAEVNADRERTALEFARKYNVICVLKGAGTVTAAPDGRALINPTGNSGMASGGSGDALAGMTGALLAQGADSFCAAAAAVYLHGLAGDIAAEKFGKISMLPTDLIDCIPAALYRIFSL